MPNCKTNEDTRPQATQTNCKQCGKDFNPLDPSMNSYSLFYCSKNCIEAHFGKSKTCILCGKTFWTNDTSRSCRSDLYCSRTCLEQKHPKQKQIHTKKTVHCIECGIPKEVDTKFYVNGKKYTCKTCYTKKNTGICKICGYSFQIYDKSRGTNSYTYCSLKCKEKDRSSNNTTVTCPICKKTRVVTKGTGETCIDCKKQTLKTTHQNILNDYLSQNLSRGDLALKYNLSISGIKNILQKFHAPKRNTNKNLDQQIIDYYQQGNSIQATCIKLHVTDTRVKKILNQNNITVRPSSHYSQNKHSKTILDIKKEETRTIIKEYYESDITRDELQKKYSLSKGTTETLTKGIRKKKTKKSSNRYIEVLLPDHPRANSAGRVLEHIYEAENKLGRELANGEVVHHKDFDPTNNSHNNLVVMENSLHSRCHGSLHRALTPLVHKEILCLDEDQSSYYINEEFLQWYDTVGFKQFIHHLNPSNNKQTQLSILN